MGLAGFIRSIDEADDPEKALLEHNLSEAESRSPELARALRFCALPRRIDVEVIGVLRGLPEDVDGNTRLLYQLLDYSFVLQREKGGYVYHDKVRGTLLDDWKQEARRPELEELTWRLVRHYEAAHARASEAEEDAARVSRIIQRASQDRFRQLAAILETGLLAPLLEAVAQLALLSPATVLEFLEGYLESYLDRSRFGACRTLIAGTRDVVLALPHGDDRSAVLDWLEFWDGVLLIRVERPAEAEEKLKALLEGDERDARLRYWTLGELGQAQRDQFKLRDSLGTFEQELALNEQSHVDALNLPVSYLRLGRTYTILDRPDVAAGHLHKAVTAAEALGNPGVIVAVLEANADRQLAQGLRRDAFESSMRALDIARTELRTRRAPQVALGESLARYFCGEDPKLLDTVLEEGDALAAGLDDPLASVRRRVDMAALLVQSGQLRRAHEVLARLCAQVEPIGSDALRADLLLEQASLDHLEGRFEEAVERLADSERLAVGAGRPGVAARARHARARALARLGRWHEAEGAFAAVERSWREHGHDPLAALAQAERAAAVRHRGDGAEADRLLGAAGEHLSGASARLRVRYFAALAEHEAASGRLAAARAAFQETASAGDAAGDLRAVATARAALSGLASEEGNWGEAARRASAAAEAAATLAERDAYTRSAEREAGDRRHADGMRLLISEDIASLDSAEELIRAALDDEADPWYRVNYSYATAALGDWSASVDALERALGDAPALRCAALERRLGEYHVARDEALASTGEHDTAAKAFAESLGRLEAPAQRAARVRCLLGLGDSLRSIGRADEAGDAYREADAAGHPAAALRLGELFAETGDRAAALEALRAGVKSSDTEIAAESAVRLIELDADHSMDEVGRIADGLRSTGGAPAALALGDRLALRGHSSAAAQVYELVAEDLPEASLRLGELHNREGDGAAARQALERALGSGDEPVMSAAAANLGELLAAEGDFEGAVDALRRAVALGGDRPSPEAALRLGELLYRRQELPEAERWLRRAADTGDSITAPRSLVCLGDLMSETGREAQADDAYRRALEYPDFEVSALAGLRLVDAIPDDAPAAQRAEIVDAVLRSGAHAGLRLAEMLVDRGDTAFAKEILGKAADLDDDLYSPDAALRLGELSVADGDPAQARRFYERALASEDATVAPEAALKMVDDIHEPPAATLERVIGLGGLAALRLGDLLAERGESDLAERAYRRVATAEHDPFSPDAQYRLSARDQQTPH